MRVAIWIFRIIGFLVLDTADKPSPSSDVIPTIQTGYSRFLEDSKNLPLSTQVYLKSVLPPEGLLKFWASKLYLALC